MRPDLFQHLHTIGILSDLLRLTEPRSSDSTHSDYECTHKHAVKPCIRFELAALRPLQKPNGSAGAQAVPQ